MNELLATLGLNGFQAIMIGLAAVLVAPVVWGKVKGVFASRPVELPPSVINDTPKLTGDGLVDVVEVWEHLIECCDEQGLTEAADEIYKVFPLFANKRGVK